MTAIFEKMVEDFRRKDTGQLLDICMHPDVSTMKKIVKYKLDSTDMIIETDYYNQLFPI